VKKKLFRPSDTVEMVFGFEVIGLFSCLEENIPSPFAQHVNESTPFNFLVILGGEG
jgi:hypothetical protein